MALLNAIRHVWASRLQLVQMQKKSPVKIRISIGLALFFPLFASSMESFLALLKNTAPTQRFKFAFRVFCFSFCFCFPTVQVKDATGWEKPVYQSLSYKLKLKKRQ